MLFFYRLINLRNASYPNSINNGSTIIPNDTTVICQDNSGEVSNLCSFVVVKKISLNPVYKPSRNLIPRQLLKHLINNN